MEAVPVNATIVVEETTRSSVYVMNWHALNVSQDAAQHYWYLVQVRENGVTEYTVEERVAHNGFDGSYDIHDGLQRNTEYVLEVTPYRIWGNITEMGTPYAKITHKTQCACMCNELGGYMARFTQFPIMITRSTIIYGIISPGAAGSSIYA